MKVLCIDSCKYNFNGSPCEEILVVGEVYLVIGFVEAPGKQFYILSEYGTTIGFESDCFFPLSDLDEMEIHKDIILHSKNSNDDARTMVCPGDRTDICLLPLIWQEGEEFTEKETSALTMLAQIKGTNLLAIWLRGYFSEGLYRQALDDLKPLCKERVRVITEFLGRELTELIGSL